MVGEDSLPPKTEIVLGQAPDKINIEIVTDHINRVWDLFEEQFIRNTKYIRKDDASRIHLDLNRLTEALDNAEIDLKRMITFHLPEADQKPDRHKYAAFFARWIAKIRPVHVTPADENRPVLSLINAFFSVWVFRSFLLYPLPDDLYLHLRYSFHFRDERGEILALLAHLGERISALEEEPVDVDKLSTLRSPHKSRSKKSRK